HRSLPEVLGTRTANLFAKLELYTVGDALRQYPRRYLQPGELTDLNALEEGDTVTVQATVVRVSNRSMRRRKGTITEVDISDGVSTGHVTFFNQPWLKGKLPVGSAAIFTGKVNKYRGKLQLTS